MILKLIIKNNKKNGKYALIAWIQKHKDFDNDIKQLLQFFKDNVQISKKRRFHTYYKIISDNPAIMISLLSSVHEIIPDICFNDNNLIEKEETLDLESF